MSAPLRTSLKAVPTPLERLRPHPRNPRRISEARLAQLWEVARPKRSDLHPTMKPVELIARALANSSVPDDFVLDPFAGSGSTLIACEDSGRRALCMEIDPVYCDVIRQRYADYTGRPELAP